MAGFRHPTAILNCPPMHRAYRDERLSWFSPEIDEEARIECLVVVEYGTTGATRIGASWLMPRVHVGHDAQIGDGCEIASGTVVAAHSVIEDGVGLGIGTVMRPFVRIGAGARTGCGAVVVSDIPAGETWVGNPARRLVEATSFA